MPSAESKNKMPSVDFPREIFITHGSQQFGPYTVEEINAKIRTGEVTGVGTFAWYQGCSQWISLDRVPGVFMLYAPPTFGACAQPHSQGDATGGLIPYKNPPALVGYYLSIFSLIPLLGIPLGIAGVICGIFGLRRRNKNPIIKGMGHALFAIIFGSLVILIQAAGIFIMIRFI